jgi:hypothetical protein
VIPVYNLPCVYWGPVQYYSKLASGRVCMIELHEHFQKQTYRNRSVICDSNGVHKLIIPLQKHSEKTPLQDIRISYDAPWQDLHWKTLESAYRSSPYFEYFEHDFISFYSHKSISFLHEYNLAIQEVVIKLLKLKTITILSEQFEKAYTGSTDLRQIISPKKNFTEDPDFILRPYPQVFESKFGFLPNLSIADLLFNEGPHAVNYL